MDGWVGGRVGGRGPSEAGYPASVCIDRCVTASERLPSLIVLFMRIIVFPTEWNDPTAAGCLQGKCRRLSPVVGPRRGR